MVKGLLASVPMAAASGLPRTSQATTRAITRCRPTKGVKITPTPQAKPRAMEDGVPGMRATRCAR